MSGENERNERNLFEQIVYQNPLEALKYERNQNSND